MKQAVLPKLKQSTISFTLRDNISDRQWYVTDFNTRSLFYSKKICVSGFIENRLLFILFWLYDHSTKSFATVAFPTINKKWDIFAEFKLYLLNSAK